MDVRTNPISSAGDLLHARWRSDRSWPLGVQKILPGRRGRGGWGQRGWGGGGSARLQQGRGQGLQDAAAENNKEEEAEEAPGAREVSVSDAPEILLRGVILMFPEFQLLAAGHSSLGVWLSGCRGQRGPGSLETQVRGEAGPRRRPGAPRGQDWHDSQVREDDMMGTCVDTDLQATADSRVKNKQRHEEHPRAAPRGRGTRCRPPRPGRARERQSTTVRSPASTPRGQLRPGEGRPINNSTIAASWLLERNLNEHQHGIRVVIFRAAPQTRFQSRNMASGARWRATRGRPSWPGGSSPRQTRARGLLTRTRARGAEAGGRTTERTPGARRPGPRSPGSSGACRRRPRGRTRPPPSPGSSPWTSWRPVRWAQGDRQEHRAPQPGIDVYLSLGDLGGSTNTQLSLTKSLTKGHVNTQDLHEPWTICFHSRVVMTGTNNSLLCQGKISNQAEIWDQRWFPDLIEFLGENQYFQIQPTSVLSPSNNWSWYFHEVTWFWSRTGDCHL